MSENILKSKDLWRRLMPRYDVPSCEQFAIWATLYKKALVIRGIYRAAAKAQGRAASGTLMSTEELVRYATGVMRNEEMGIREFSSRAA